MARPLMSDGTRYPRKRPVNWRVVHDVLRFRRFDRRAIKDGFVKVNAFSGLRWESPHCDHTILETRINLDGTALYVKLAPKQ